ncbi:uncharacterized protein PHACADRAFT_27396 [Phanerochaete carnosa HHB-10118-sp]|uniref:Cyanovirin-N domain-containing protein n=1 Tax=Phanerochaete carnosa (strain HHB-10118-sp) TaxID=650164 RepID=K5VYD0_PHACS|nr:uncharacterized protein PHACADRAFT_27396 [Phanerochaete carnosa HHB-10118-sp]EKM56593.1 hypothetical protein PHACADRAFT_27396 [Phanerochaete carnosa HHB-10118-sp]
MFFSSRSALVSAFLLVASVQQGLAVCSSGQMGEYSVLLSSPVLAHIVLAAVGTEFLQEFTGPNSAFNEYSGFLMANNCGLIAQNGLTQATDQMCKGGYNKGASVTCDSSGNPIAAVDTEGQSWTCSATNDDSCDVGGSGGRFTVLACCNRN